MIPRWSGTDEVFSVFHRHTKAERLRLLRAFNQITESPSNHENFTRAGRDGRIYSVAHVGSWEFTYWIDPDHEIVRFVALESVR